MTTIFLEKFESFSPRRELHQPRDGTFPSQKRYSRNRNDLRFGRATGKRCVLSSRDDRPGLHRR